MLILELNKKNEVTKIRFSSDGVGQIKTTVVKHGKGGN